MKILKWIITINVLITVHVTVNAQSYNYFPVKLNTVTYDSLSKLQFGLSLNNYGVNPHLGINIGPSNFLIFSAQVNNGNNSFDPLNIQNIIFNELSQEFISAVPGDISYFEVMWGGVSLSKKQKLEISGGFNSEFNEEYFGMFIQGEWAASNHIIEASYLERISLLLKDGDSKLVAQQAVQFKLNFDRFRFVNQFGFASEVEFEYVRPIFNLGLEIVL